MFLFLVFISLLFAWQTASQSQSQSRSRSYSSGTCADYSSTLYFPNPGPPDTVNETYPLWPTNVDIYLSGSNKHPHNHGTTLYIYYNLSHFTELNPELAPSCDLLPDVSGVPYIVDTESWYQFGHTQPGVNRQCEMLCVVWLQFALECPMTAGSGTYYVKIPGVGEVELNMTICTNEGVDYGVNCDLIPKECQHASPFMVQIAPVPPTPAPKTHSGLTKADKVGISFGVVGGAMLIVIIALSVVYHQASTYVARFKPTF